jgi:alpha-L-arabinofuranosidase
MRARRGVRAAALTLGFAAAAASLPAPALAAASEIDIAAGAPGRPVNRLVLGSNVEWVDRGDGLVDAQGQFVPAFLDAARALGPTSLRYPGGSQADLFHWRVGIGPVRERGRLTHFFTGEAQKVVFGIDEFLHLCALLDAAPVITLNAATGGAEEAAGLVDYAAERARAGAAPRVRFWEVGNEPYLRDDKHPNLAVGAAEYARRFNLFASAVRGRDKDAMVGVALHNDTIGGVPATPFPGFDRTVLAALERPPDFAAVHDAYMPYTPGKLFDDRALLLALMAASGQVAADLDATEAELAKRWPGRAIPLALTEWSAMFTTTGMRTDGYIASPAAALYEADLLMLLAAREDVLVANHWSLLGNWYFGAIANSGAHRPAFAVVSAIAQSLKGNLVPVRVATTPMETPQVGMVAANPALPRIHAIAVRNGERLVVFVLNRDIDAAASLSVKVEDKTIGATTAREYHAASPFAGPASWSPVDVRSGAHGFAVTLGPAAFAIVEAALGEEVGARPKPLQTSPQRPGR